MNKTFNLNQTAKSVYLNTNYQKNRSPHSDYQWCYLDISIQYFGISWLGVVLVVWFFLTDQHLISQNSFSVRHIILFYRLCHSLLAYKFYKFLFRTGYTVCIHIRHVERLITVLILKQIFKQRIKKVGKCRHFVKYVICLM